MNISDIKPFEEQQDKIVLHRVKFVILLVLQIPAIVISLFIFIFFMKHRALVNVHQNQALLVLLIVNFIALTADLPMPIQFYRIGYVIPATATYCTWWTYFEYSLNLISELLMAVISIQRHILVFQPRLLDVRLKRYIIYYLPLLFCVMYPPIFYLIIIVFYPCDGTQWVFTSNLCGYANCYLVYNKVLSSSAWALNNGLTSFTIFLANAVLVIRVVQQKRRRQQLVTWKKQRRMTLQLLGISSLYMIGWVPSLISGLGQRTISPSFLAQVQLDYLLDLIYVVCLGLPWVCYGLLPEFNKWISKPLRRGQVTRNTVGPTINTVGPTISTVGPIRKTVGATFNTVGPTLSTVELIRKTAVPKIN